MGIHFIEPPNFKHPEMKDQKPKFEPRLVDLEERNFSFGPIALDIDSLLGKTIATLPIDSFLPSTEESVEIWKHIRAGISARVSMVADADALIVDLRHNHGGEDMAYGLQAFKRAVAVVGEGNEATAGAANPITKPLFLCEEEFGDKWWLAAIPTLQPLHPVTQTNWEGVGVRSDVVAGKGEWIDVDDAKLVATRLAVRVLEQGKNEL